MKPMIAYKLTHGEKHQLTHPRIGQPAMDHAQAAACLLKVKEIFDRRELIFWFRGGTLLGAIRDGDFIPTDNDIDIGIYEDDAERVFPAILELEVFGLKVVRTDPYDNSFQVKKNLICFGFGSVSKHRGYMWRYSRVFEPRDFFSDFIDWPFLGTTFRVPKNYVEYLELHYAEDGNKDAWKTPNPSKKPRLFRVPKKYL